MGFHTVKQGWKAGNLIKSTSHPEPYDLIGFQECNYIWKPLGYAGYGPKDYYGYHTDNNICLAVRKKTWEVLTHGEQIVANDKGQFNNYGPRKGLWDRIRHRKTNQTVFFVNHHGPLPLSSGGLWGGPTTARKLLNLIRRNGTKDDAAILIGDFNSNAQSITVKQLGCNLRRIISGTVFSGVDHIFSNVGKSHVVSTKLLEKGGSDHNALQAVFKL